MVTEKVLEAITDVNVQDIVDTAAYGGITYWACEPTAEEFAALPDDKKYTIVEGEQPHPVFGGQREVEEVHYLSKDQIRAATARLLDLNQEIVNRSIHDAIVQAWIDRDEMWGLDTCHIDAGAADAIVQVACFGEVKYG